MIAVGLAAPAVASALTSSQTQKAVAGKLDDVYDNAWLNHTPSWSKPECLPPEDESMDGVLCISEANGITCTLTAGAAKGKGFRINKDRLSASGS